MCLHTHTHTHTYIHTYTYIYIQLCDTYRHTDTVTQTVQACCLYAGCHINQIKNILKGYNLTAEMVDIFFCRAWLHTWTLESTPSKIAKGIVPRVLPRSEGGRFRLFLECLDPHSSVNPAQLEAWIKKLGPTSRFTLENMRTEARDEFRRPIVSPAAWRISFETFPPALVDVQHPCTVYQW